jgi:hypothetical protein
MGSPLAAPPPGAPSVGPTTAVNDSPQGPPNVDPATARAQAFLGMQTGGGLLGGLFGGAQNGQLDPEVAKKLPEQLKALGVDTSKIKGQPGSPEFMRSLGQALEPFEQNLRGQLGKMGIEVPKDATLTQMRGLIEQKLGKENPFAQFEKQPLMDLIGLLTGKKPGAESGAPGAPGAPEAPGAQRSGQPGGPGAEPQDGVEPGGPQRTAPQAQPPPGPQPPRPQAHRHGVQTPGAHQRAAELRAAQPRRAAPPEPEEETQPPALAAPPAPAAPAPGPAAPPAAATPAPPAAAPAAPAPRPSQKEFDTAVGTLWSAPSFKPPAPDAAVDTSAMTVEQRQQYSAYQVLRRAQPDQIAWLRDSKGGAEFVQRIYGAAPAAPAPAAAPVVTAPAAAPVATAPAAAPIAVAPAPAAPAPAVPPT